MRKITRDAVEAFVTNTEFSRSNTIVFSGVTKQSMVLFGNTIAIMDHGKLSISTCGFESITTKERLNGLCSYYLGHNPIKQRKGIWYFNDIPFSELEGTSGYFQVWPDLLDCNGVPQC